MTRLMYDDIAPGTDIPADAVMVAGYVDGLYRWADADWDRFPNAVKVRIACFASTNDGHVIDIEWGNSQPPAVPGWLTMRRAAGIDPSVYCSASIQGQIRNACQAAGVAEPHWWLACYDGNPSLTAACLSYQIDGVVAKQYADSTLSGGHYDLSVVADYWPGVDPPQEEPVFRIDQYLPGYTTTIAAGTVVRAGPDGDAAVIRTTTADEPWTLIAATAGYYWRFDPAISGQYEFAEMRFGTEAMAPGIQGAPAPTLPSTPVPTRLAPGLYEVA